MAGDFLGGPVIKTPHLQCRRRGLIPGHGTKIPYAERQIQKKKKNTEWL